MLANLTYTVPRSDNVRVPLISGGAQKPVGPAGLPQYCDMIEHFRRHEFDMQCAAMLKGLCQLIPPRSLPLFSWEELENLVCGSKTVDVLLLQRHTTYALLGWIHRLGASKGGGYSRVWLVASAGTSSRTMKATRPSKLSGVSCSPLPTYVLPLVFRSLDRVSWCRE
jgi:hypothetical protein